MAALIEPGLAQPYLPSSGYRDYPGGSLGIPLRNTELLLSKVASTSLEGVPQDAHCCEF